MKTIIFVETEVIPASKVKDNDIIVVRDKFTNHLKGTVEFNNTEKNYFLVTCLGNTSFEGTYIGKTKQELITKLKDKYIFQIVE